MSTALDRLKNALTSDDIIDTSSINSDDYFDDLEDDILSKMNGKISEVNLDDAEPTDNADYMPDDYVQPQAELPSEPVRDKIEEVLPEKEQITIDVTDTGDDEPFNVNDIPTEINITKPVKSNNEGLFNNNTGNMPIESEGKRRGRKKKREDVELPNKAPAANENASIDSSKTTVENNPLYDQLINLMLNELEHKHFKFNGLNDSSMSILFDYIRTKF